MKIHIISGCDTTSKIGTKAAALKKKPEKHLQLFEEGVDDDLVFRDAEKYLLELLSTTSSSGSFDELRCYMYTNKRKHLHELPPNPCKSICI